MKSCLAMVSAFILVSSIALGEEVEMDEVEESIRQLSAVEATKMLEQARQYCKMETRKTTKAAAFLYKEILRRYPKTPHARHAEMLLGMVMLQPDIEIRYRSSPLLAYPLKQTLGYPYTITGNKESSAERERYKKLLEESIRNQPRPPFIMDKMLQSPFNPENSPWPNFYDDVTKQTMRHI